MSKAICDVCFRHCSLSEGQTGFCKARVCHDGAIVPATYGHITSLALDPIEKKPLYHFYPGSKIVSAGGYGCNLACPFCQNHSISLSEYSLDKYAGHLPNYEIISPEDLASVCVEQKKNGNIGIAFTYNEPTISYEYIIDTAKLIRRSGLKTVLVTNGSATAETLDKLLPYVDAMNVDLKSFDEDYYKNVLRGDLETTKQFIERATESCHVEVTTLIIPGENDTVEEVESIAGWLAVVGVAAGKDIPLHITRFFPRSRYSDRRPTPVDTIYTLVDVAKKHLKYVHAGNV